MKHNWMIEGKFFLRIKYTYKKQNIITKTEFPPC